MNKSEMFKAREQRILESALNIARNKGTFDFRMADVARSSECSVGTIYGHFLSKEDLMAALVQVGLGRRQVWFEQLETHKLAPLEKFVALLIAEQRRLVQDETLAQLELLMNHTELWRRVADRRQLALREENALLVEALKVPLRVAVDSGHLQLDEDGLTLLVDRALALLLGFQVQTSRQTLVVKDTLADDQVLMEALADLLVGAGLTTTRPDWRQQCLQALDACHVGSLAKEEVEA